MASCLAASKAPEMPWPPTCVPVSAPNIGEGSGGASCRPAGGLPPKTWPDVLTSQYRNHRPETLAALPTQGRLRRAPVGLCTSAGERPPHSQQGLLPSVSDPHPQNGQELQSVSKVWSPPASAGWGGEGGAVLSGLPSKLSSTMAAPGPWQSNAFVRLVEPTECL